MSQTRTSGLSLLVVVTPGRAATETVAYALREARDSAAELDERIDVEVVVVTSRSRPDSTDTEDAIRETIRTVEAELPASVSVCSAADPAQLTDALLEYVGGREVSRVIVPGDTGLSVERLRDRFGQTTVELAPAGTSHRRRRLLHPGGLWRLVTVFGISYLFYLAIGGFSGGLDYFTGAISAAVVALSLSRVALQQEPAAGRAVTRLGRTVVFVPVLLWEVLKANLVIAYLILHPRLPIDPSIDTLETETTEGLERMVLANSITLTPGTVTVDVSGSEFTIHALTTGSREGLEQGRLQRLVAWVFHGSTATEGTDTR